MISEATKKVVETALSVDAGITPDTRETVMNVLTGRADASNATEKLLTIKQAAGVLAVHEKSLWLILRREKIQTVKLGPKCRRVRQSDIDALILRAAVPTVKRTLPHEFHAMKAEG